MGAGVPGEGPHKPHASRLGRDAGADQMDRPLPLPSQRVLDGPHVEPARGGILAVGQRTVSPETNCSRFEASHWRRSSCPVTA